MSLIGFSGSPAPFPSPIVSDSFNRADSSTGLGTADTGQAWQSIAQTWGITGDKAYIVSSTSNDGFAYIDSGISDCVISVKILDVEPSGAEGAGRIVFRSDVGGSIEWWVQFDPSVVYLIKRNGTTYTTVVTVNASVPSGSVGKVVLNGSLIRVLLNDEEIIRVSDTFCITSTIHGIGGQNASNYRYMSDFNVYPYNTIWLPVLNSANVKPVIHVTDLLNYNVSGADPDDYFDNATLFSLENIDLRAVILNRGSAQLSNSGTTGYSGGTLIDQLNSIFGRQVPYGIGLGSALTSTTDTGESQADEYQGGVQLLLDTLTDAPSKVDLTVACGMTEVAAAYNRNPSLFQSKVDRIFVFCGEADATQTGYTEWNVNLDVNAFVAIMNSGLNIYWVPCFDGGEFVNNGKASYWQTSPEQGLMTGITSRMEQYLIYNILKKTSEPLAFLAQAVNSTDQTNVYSPARNMWGGGVFGYITGNYDPAVFDFTSVTAAFNSSGQVSYGSGNAMQQFVRQEVESAYTTAMTSKTNSILVSGS